MLYLAVLVLKLAAVLTFAGGLVAAFVATEPADRRRAVHRIASPALLVVWLSGYALAVIRGVSLMELWILASLVLSTIAQGALVVAVTKNKRGLPAFASAALPILLVLVLMVFRPTWQMVSR